MPEWYAAYSGLQLISTLAEEMKASLPVRLAVLHTVAILFFMITLYKGWFLTDIPYDCFYIPFIFVSGPLVYFIAHDFQHLSESFFRNAPVMIVWNLVPGSICILLGGLQWWFIGRGWLWLRKERANKTIEPTIHSSAVSGEARHE